MKNLLIVTPHFYPENFRINDLAFSFAKRGYRVDVLTAVPDYPEGRYYKGYGIFKKSREVVNGVRVYRSPIIARGEGRGFNLGVNYLSLLFGSVITAVGLIRNGYDLVFVYEPSPITIGIPAIIIKKALRIPLVFWVLDLWPESVIAASNVRKQFIIRWLDWIVAWTYKHSDKVLVSSRGYIASVNQKVDSIDKVEYFPQWAEPIFRPMKVSGILPKSIPSNSFIIMFAGNIGEAQDFPSIIEAANSLKHIKSIQWVILGNGRKKVWLENKIKEMQMEECFHLLGSFSLEEMPKFYAEADAMLFSLKREDIFSLTVPAKVQSYLACGKPIIAMIDGEGATIIEEARAGLTCAAEEPSRLAKNIIKMSELSVGERKKMGSNAVKYYCENFERNALLNKIEGVFNTLQPRTSE